MKNIGFLFLFILITSFVYSQKDAGSGIDVRPVTMKLQNEGHQLFYALPRNLVRIKLTVTQTESIRGPYAEFGEKYLNITEGAIQENSMRYDISGVGFSRISFPDSSKYYVINYSGIENCPGLQLNPDGVILGCNVDNVIPAYFSDQSLTIQPDLESDDFFFTDLGVGPFMQDKTETGMKAVMKDSVMVKVPVTLSKLVPATPEENAANASGFIRKLRKRRLKLVADLYQETNPSEGPAIEQMIKELDLLEKQYVELFIGKTITSSKCYFFDFVPDDDVNAEQKMICWISPNLGISAKKPDLRKSDYRPVTILSTLTGNIPGVQISVMDNSGKSPVPIRHGLYYRIPATVELSIQVNDQIIAKQNMLVAQKGQISTLPVDYLIGQKYGIEFYPETGAIKAVVKKKENQP